VQVLLCHLVEPEKESVILKELQIVQLAEICG
jgi:hypothetical protein